MARQLAVAVLLMAALAGCETKTPIGPVALPTTTSTTTTTVPLTATTTIPSTTTTTIVLGSLARRYVAFQPPANTPSETTLFFELLSAGAGASALAAAVPFGGPATEQVIENHYRVTGVYAMPNGTTGNITGVLGGSSNPLETGGDFTGTFTAQTPTGCTAQRPFAGRINPQTLQLSGTDPGTATCSPSPLNIPPITMLRSDPGAPLPTTIPTTSTTSTTTVPCTYTLKPDSLTIGSEGGQREVGITAPAGCTWAVHSFADWIVFNPPFGGSGTGGVSFNVGPNTTGSARSGTLLIAGHQFTVFQSAAFVDLIPSLPPPGICTFNSSIEAYTVTATILNQGNAAAGPSVTRFVFTYPPNGSSGSEPPSPIRDESTTGIPAGGSVPVSTTIPSACFRETSDGWRCDFSVTADQNNQVPESNEANNGPLAGWCFEDNSLFATAAQRVR